MSKSYRNDDIANSRAFWNARTARLGPDAPLEAYGTLTHESEVVALRDAIEREHVFEHLPLRAGARVLDLGGGAGRFALRIAPEVAHVTLVDLSEALLEVARKHASALGIANIRFVHAAAQEFTFDGGPYDVILILGVALYLDDVELGRLIERCAAALVPGGTLLLKEPVTTDGVPRDQHDANDGVPYHARLRPREVYAERFGTKLTLRYQSATVAHLIPWFIAGTEGAVQVTSGATARKLLRYARPLWVPADPLLRKAERRIRRGALAPLLAEIPVVQDLYVFAAPDRAPSEAPPIGDEPQLSVVVIAYNEELCVAQVADELAGVLDRARIDYELVLVDDGSSDGTLAQMQTVAERRPRARVVALGHNRGIGGALRAGFDAARGLSVTWVPGDGQIPPPVLVDLYRRRNEATMLTTVYRVREDPWYRHAISHSLNTMIKLKTGVVAKSGGNYLFERSAWLECAPRDDDSMMISTAFRHGLRRAGKSIIEVEIDCRPRVAGHSKVLNPRTIWRTLAALGRIGGQQRK